MQKSRINMMVGLALAAVMAAGAGCSRRPSTHASATGAAGAESAPSQDAREAPPAPTPAPPPPVTVAQGTVLKVRTTTALSTESSRAGDSFVAGLEEPLVVEGQVIAPKGAQVEGVVAESNKGGRVKGRAAIAVRLTKLHTADGGVAEIRTLAVARRARSTKRQDALKIGAGGGVGAAIGAIAGGGMGAAIGAVSGAGAGTGYVLATRGAPAVIPSESVLRFKLAAPFAVSLPAERR